MNCIDVCADAVYIGADALIGCICVEQCQVIGCYWRVFHKLQPEQFKRPPQQAFELQQINGTRRARG